MLLLVDLDDTLADSRAAFRRWLPTWLEQFDPADRPQMQQFLIEAEMTGNYPSQFSAAFVAAYPGHMSAEVMVDNYFRLGPTHYELVPAARERLQRARELGWRTAVVTNGPAQLQRGKVDTLGLSGLVDEVLISGEVGCAKPDPRIFQLAADRLGGALQDGWMVGDNPESDIGGAHQVGMRTAWIGRPDAWPRQDFAPTVIAPTFELAMDEIHRALPLQ